MWAIQQSCEWSTIGAKVSMGWTAATWEMVHWCLKQRQRNDPSCLMFIAQKKKKKKCWIQKSEKKPRTIQTGKNTDGKHDSYTPA